MMVACHADANIVVVFCQTSIRTAGRMLGQKKASIRAERGTGGRRVLE